ncbi:MAG: metal-dependent phosphohydrolase [Treponema sp.]|jgi:hypothetical protein|nr:metal-dependent phosphohydrolase [Treponema sp.]
MQENDAVFRISKTLSPDGSGVNKEYLEVMIKEDVPVICVNQGQQKRRVMPFKILFSHNNRFWQRGGEWEYFLSEENLNKVKSKAVTGPGIWESVIGKQHGEKTGPERGYGVDYDSIAVMTTSQRVQRIVEKNYRLNELIAAKTKDPAIVTGALVDSTQNAALVNHATLLDAMHHSDEEAREMTQNMVNSTLDMVKASSQLVEADILNDELMNILLEKSNGTIIQHITRVYLSGVSFLSYYNKLILTTSTVDKLRIAFPAKYRAFYQDLLPHLSAEDVTLERVFYKGMRAIPPNLFFSWAVGFLIHDIGKAAAVEYHEGEDAYNREVVTEHVEIGYKSIISKTNYPHAAALITGYHHEYYGDASGYGYFRTYLEQFRRKNPGVKQNYCISYELEPMLNCITLAYFPAKVLEIIDVYDSVTDPHRAYRKVLSSEEAVKMIREEFIEKTRKLDTVLFDIFISYINDTKKK